VRAFVEIDSLLRPIYGHAAPLVAVQGSTRPLPRSQETIYGLLRRTTTSSSCGSGGDRTGE
jgi:hypothetical protein